MERKKVELENLEKSKGKLQEKEDEIETVIMQSIAENMLKEGNERLTVAISKNDMNIVEIAYTLIDSAKKKLDIVNKLCEEQKNKTVYVHEAPLLQSSHVF